MRRRNGMLLALTFVAAACADRSPTMFRGAIVPAHDQDSYVGETYCHPSEEPQDCHDRPPTKRERALILSAAISLRCEPGRRRLAEMAGQDLIRIRTDTTEAPRADHHAPFGNRPARLHVRADMLSAERAADHGAMRELRWVLAHEMGHDLYETQDQNLANAYGDVCEPDWKTH